MTPAALRKAVPQGATVLLDTSAVLAYLSGAESTSAAAAVVIDDLVRGGRNRAVVSAITVTEALVRPMRAGSPSAVQIVDDFLFHFPNLEIVPATTAIAREAARIRAATAAPTPDALILATAVSVSATVAIGSDRSWPAFTAKAGLPLEVVLL